MNSSLPYFARKCYGIWCVVNQCDTPIVQCECRCQAEEFAIDLNEQSHRERARNCGFPEIHELRDIPFVDPNGDLPDSSGRYDDEDSPHPTFMEEA